MGFQSRKEPKGRGTALHVGPQSLEGPWGSAMCGRERLAGGVQVTGNQCHTLDLAAVTGAAAGCV